MKVLIEIDEEYLDIIKGAKAHGADFKPYNIIANGTSLNGTNGEVLKTVFPNAVIVHKIRENKREIVFSDDCWNADYKEVE